MSDQVFAQLRLAALVLDRATAPVAVEEITGRSAVDDAFSSRGIQRPRLVEFDGDTNAPIDRRRRTGLLVAAAAVLVVGGIAGLSSREPQLSDSQEATGNGPVTASTSDAPASTINDDTSTTIDPLSDLNLPPGAMPPDLVQRFTSSLGEFGQLWVYDSSSTDPIYFVRRGPDETQFGNFDRSTYESGQGWGLAGQPGPDLLFGLTSPSFPVTVTFGDTTVSSDDNGAWYTLVPEDLAGFTITTPNDEINISLATSAETPQTTTVTTT